MSKEPVSLEPEPQEEPRFYPGIVTAVIVCGFLFWRMLGSDLWHWLFG